MNSFESAITKGFEVLTSKLLSEKFLYEDEMLSFEKRDIPTVLFSYTDYVEFCIRYKEKNEINKMRRINNKILELLAKQIHIYNKNFVNIIGPTMEAITSIVFSKYELNSFHTVTKAFSYVFLYTTLNRKELKTSEYKIKIRLSFAEKNEANINITNYLKSRRYLGNDNLSP